MEGLELWHLVTYEHFYPVNYDIRELSRNQAIEVINWIASFGETEYHRLLEDRENVKRLDQ
jgi:hypothetical protein